MMVKGQPGNSPAEQPSLRDQEKQKALELYEKEKLPKLMEKVRQAIALLETK